MFFSTVGRLIFARRASLGRETVSGTASAATASFLGVLTQGFTRCGVMSLTVCPGAASFQAPYVGTATGLEGDEARLMAGERRAPLKTFA